MTLYFSDSSSYIPHNYSYKLWNYLKVKNTELNTYPKSTLFESSNFEGKYEISELDNALCFNFLGKLDSYQISFNLPYSQLATGLLFNLELDGWEEISYLALGFTDADGFAHVKVENPSQGLHIPIDLSFKSIAWKLYQEHDEANITDIRIYLRGKPSVSGACIKLYEIGYIESTNTLVKNEIFQLTESTSSALFEYLKYIFPNYQKQTLDFLSSGKCPLINNVNLEWGEQHIKPVLEAGNNTLRYSWFALHPVLILLLDYYYNHNNNALNAAYDVFITWYNESFIKAELDAKYNWYDHGVSERQIATILLHQALSNSQQLSANRLKRLEYVIRQQAELLASEVFYCRDQIDRYHNHGCFQDLALLISADLNSKGKQQQFWTKLAILRLEDQITNIVYLTAGYAISKENSLGYQYVLYRILEMFSGILFHNKRLSVIPDIAKNMKAFLRLYKYPNGEYPAFGDTFKYHIDDIEPLLFTPGVYNFKEAGYVLFKEYFLKKEFYLSFFSTSLGIVHKHQDNLSFTLFFDGVEWFNDPSFYSHEYDSDAPKYLRSAYGHNNVVVLNKDYDAGIGKANISNVFSNAEKFHLSASHACYRNIEISRDIDVCINSASILISDLVKRSSGSEEEQANLIFQLGVGVEAKCKNSTITLTHPCSNHTITIEMNSAEIQLFKGFDSNSLFKGITGTGFMQAKDTVCVVQSIQFEQKIETKISIR